MYTKSIDPQVFTLVRHTDETGLSGTGRVIDGVIFHTGQVVICWRTDISKEKNSFSSIAIYDSWEAFEHIHIHPHSPSQTEIFFNESPLFPFINT